MTDLFATITEADKGLAYPRMSLLCKHSPGYGCEACKPLKDPTPAHIPRARTHLPACNVLALDFGTYCGWAIADTAGQIRYGTEHFIDRNKWHCGQRWSHFRAWLSKVLAEEHIQAVYFEDVKAHGPGQVIAAHVYGGFLAMAQMVCHQHNVRMVGVGVSTVKKAFTGKGNANKEAMVATALAKGFRIGKAEHDTADALAILSFAVKQEQ